jgi:hypothetical protein
VMERRFAQFVFVSQSAILGKRMKDPK